MFTDAKIQRQEMYTFIRTIFPEEDAQQLTELMSHGSHAFPGDNHADILAELCNVPEDSALLHDLRIVYVIFANHYFLLDAAVDGHLQRPTDILYATHLLILVLYHLLEGAAAALSADEKRRLVQIMGQRVASNAAGIRREVARRSTVDGGSAEDYAIIVGRSNLPLLFYELLCLLTGTSENDEIKQVIADVLYFMQLGDDVGDWRSDLEQRNYTPLLQECLSRLPEESRNDVTAIEEKVYLEGVFEAYMAQLINNLDRLEERVRAIPDVRHGQLEAYIRDRRRIAFNLLYEVLETKIAFLRKVDANRGPA